MQAGGSSFATLGSSGSNTEIGPIPEGEVSMILPLSGVIMHCAFEYRAMPSDSLHMLERHGREMARCAWQSRTLRTLILGMSSALLHLLAQLSAYRT